MCPPGDISQKFLYLLFIVCLHTSVLYAQLSKSKNKPPGSTSEVPVLMTSVAWSLIFSESFCACTRKDLDRKEF